MTVLYLSIIIGLAASVATFLGGLFAIRFKDKLHLILGFSAGAVLGVAFFDLMPEAISLGAPVYDASLILFFVAIGFLSFMVLERSVGVHAHNHGELRIPQGRIGALSLAFHSFLDGAAVGLAFQVSHTVGMVVAAAVLVHDFSDGINTVSLILKSGGTKKEAFRWLIGDSIAPVLGVFATMFFTLPQSALAIVLALFSGFFLYISASDLLPESYHGHPTRWTTYMTIIGAGIMFIAIQLAGTH